MHAPGYSGAVELVTRQVPLVEILVRGDLDALSAPRIKEVLDEAMALQPRRIIIDLADCPSIDAAGIMLLLDAHRRAIRNGGMVALRSPGERLCRNLRLAHVDRVLQVIRSAPDAAQNTSPDAAATAQTA